MGIALKRFLAGPWPVVGMFLLLAGSLGLMAEATQSSSAFHRWQWWVASFNGILALGLLGLIGISVMRLARRLKRRETGSRLSLRMTAMFTSFTLIPTTMVFGFAVWLIFSGIDSWFDVDVDDTLQKAVDLSRSSVDMQMRERRAQVERLLQEPTDTGDLEATVMQINDLMVQTGAMEASLLDTSNTIIVSQGESPNIVPDLPGEAQLQLLQESGVTTAQEDHPDYGRIVRILMQIPVLNQELPLTLQALYPISEHMLGLTHSVESAAKTYQLLLELRQPLKFNLTFVMSLALLLGLLFAVWAALYSAQRILSPISELARGMQAVATGEYSQRLPTGRRDELGLMVHSYNDMIGRLASARYMAETRRQVIEQQHAYLHAVLEHLSTGVISVDDTYQVITANQAASAILGVDLERYLQRPLETLRRSHPRLDPLWNLFGQKQRDSAPGMRQQVQINDELRTLHCYGVELPKEAGYVVVFEDITDLQQAQRQAAWGEVARRLAHEIKNPLTPIRLSAERVQHRIRPQLDAEEADILQDATQTIVRQVEAVKHLIDEFKDYSTDSFAPELLDLNALSAEVLGLYLENSPNIAVRSEFSQTPAWIRGDPNRIRQLLHNLIKNALEAQEGQDEGFVLLTTHAEGSTVVLKVHDGGPGFAADILLRVFEPYVTTKPDGNGLGLAVVYRITEDHQGRIRVYNEASGGGCVRVEFDAVPPPQEDPNQVDGA